MCVCNIFLELFQHFVCNAEPNVKGANTENTSIHGDRMARNKSAKIATDEQEMRSEKGEGNKKKQQQKI